MSWTSKLPMILALLAVASLAGLVAAGGAPAASPRAGSKPLAGAPGDRPVVVELFTSQGCSSCPPADRLLSRLGSGAAGGVQVIPLSFHVDYWNYIGWTDPFSDPRWSARQESYARVLGNGRLYTPQAVIQGGEDCVGSRASCVESAIARAALERAPAELTAVAEPSAAAVSVRAAGRVLSRQGTRGAEGPIEAVAILFEKDLRTPVSRGENARRELENDYVVRRLMPLFEMAGGPGSEGSGEAVLELAPGWKRGHLGVAVLLQERASRRILAAWAEDGLARDAAGR